VGGICADDHKRGVGLELVAFEKILDARPGNSKGSDTAAFQAASLTKSVNSFDACVQRLGCLVRGEDHS
jgi:hypothetical protein